MKIHCKKCEYLRHRGGARNGSITCSEVKEDTFYEQKEGDPSIINKNNNCEHFKEKKKMIKESWFYWFSFPWY